ncbi:MAG: transcription antitermination factor NusB [Bacteroidota bacterium]
MYNSDLVDHTVLNRRFVRLQALCRLYAFYVCKQANYAWSLDQINDAMAPDVFADTPIDKLQLAQASQQAISLFTAYLTNSSTPTSVLELSSSHTRTVVAQALTRYKNELAKDVRSLEMGLTAAITKINQACVRIWQLLVAWADLAKQQTGSARLRQHVQVVSAAISHSQVLQHLQNSRLLARLVQQEDAGWQDHVALAARWYNRFVKQCPAVQQYCAYPMTPYQDKRLLVFLMEGVIFKERDIQAFFSDLDLNWSIHKRIVNKQVRRGLVRCIQEGPAASLPLLDLTTEGAQAQRFYTDLVTKTLQQDSALESLIAAKAKNWSIDRIMLLDKTIMKLALCEMLHFEDIPIKVSINEYIDLSKIYSMPKSSQFVNGLLDTIAATIYPKHGNKA